EAVEAAIAKEPAESARFCVHAVNRSIGDTDGNHRTINRLHHGDRITLYIPCIEQVQCMYICSYRARIALFSPLSLSSARATRFYPSGSPTNAKRSAPISLKVSPSGACPSTSRNARAPTSGG